MTSMATSLQHQPNAAAGRWFRNTAELSGEPSAGDLVAAGDVLLAVASVGWEPVAGPLTEVRTHQQPPHARPGDRGRPRRPQGPAAEGF
jgi:hypothetical protein